MIIVGISGAIGHGKSTFASYLSGSAASYRNWESSDLINAVANDLRSASSNSPPVDDVNAINVWLLPLTKILNERTHIDVNFGDIELTSERLKATPDKYTKLIEYLKDMQTNPDQVKTVITIQNKTQFRALLQWLGGYLVVQLGDIWYNEILREIAAYPNLDIATISGVRFPGDAEAIRRAGGTIIIVKRYEGADQDISDLTERHRGLIMPDAIIHNNASLAQYKSCATQVYSDLIDGNLKPEYLASSF
jgi:hypothetical protein